MASVVTRKFGEEALQFLGKKVSVETSDQKIYSGTLAGIDERLDVVLDNVEGQGILKSDHQWLIYQGSKTDGKTI